MVVAQGHIRWAWLALTLLGVVACGGSARPKDAGHEAGYSDGGRDAADDAVDATALDAPADTFDAQPDVVEVGHVQQVLVATGTYHSCRVNRAGRTYCCGTNADGQLGAAALSIAMVPSLATGIAETDVAVLVAGHKHNCAATSYGKPTCWGQNTYGQLGNDSLVSSPTAVVVTGLSDIVSLAAGLAFSCAANRSGVAFCWGQNTLGQLGNDSTIDTKVPVAVSGLGDAIALAAGAQHACALQRGGTVVCWGDNRSGQLGNDAYVPSSKPVAVVGLSDATAIAAGIYHTCAATSTGKAVCWGSNYSGLLGDGTMNPSAVPVAVSGLNGVIAVAADGGYFTCALRDAGDVYCWGGDGYGELGNGVLNVSSMVPVAVVGLTNAIAISASDEHTCVVTREDEIFCWGWNVYGELGNNASAGSGVAVPVKAMLPP